MEFSQNSNLVLVTRPAPDCYDYAEELKAQGFQVFCEPMLVMEPVDFLVPVFSNISALIFTSAQGVRFFLNKKEVLPDIFSLPVYCVGKYTARAAENAGFKKVENIDGTGQDLCDYITNHLQPSRDIFLHVRGRDPALEIDKVLQDFGFRAENLIVYNAEFVRRFSDDFLRLLKASSIKYISFFSKRTAQNFVKILDYYEMADVLKGTKLLSISPAVLECVQDYPWHSMYVSEVPNREGMLKILKQAQSDPF